MAIQTDKEKLVFQFREIINHPMTLDFKIEEDSYVLSVYEDSNNLRLPKPSEDSEKILRLDYALKELDKKWVNTPPGYRFSEKYQWLSQKIDSFYKAKSDELSTEDFNLLSLYEKKLAELEEFANGTY